MCRSLSLRVLIAQLVNYFQMHLYKTIPPTKMVPWNNDKSFWEALSSHHLSLWGDLLDIIDSHCCLCPEKKFQQTHTTNFKMNRRNKPPLVKTLMYTYHHGSQPCSFHIPLSRARTNEERKHSWTVFFLVRYEWGLRNFPDKCAPTSIWWRWM